MKKKKNGLLRAFKYICLAGVIGFGLMTIISTGGGGDDVGSGGGEPTFLDVYDYWLTTIGPGHFNVSFTEDPDTFTISVKTLGPWLTGTYNTATEAYTLDSGAGASIDSDVGDDLLGQFNIEVTSPIQIPSYDSEPTAGAFEVEFGAEKVTVTVVSGPPAGVNLNLEGGAGPVFFPWDDFENLLGSGAPDWQQRAALSGSILEFMIQQVDYVVVSIGYIGDNEDELQQNITVTENCDAFPQGAAPQGVLQQGTRALSWDDASGNGEVGGGDNFTWTLTDCWDDDQGDNIDDLINGTVDLDSYTEVVDGSNRVTRIGFEGQGGGVVFTDFVVSEVEEEPLGTFTIDQNADITVNGGFTIVFTE